MIKNFLKIAWRNLARNKSLSFINIFGLAAGITFALLIGLWIQYETSYDAFHSNKDRIALVLKNTLYNNQKNTQEPTPLPLYDELRNNYPEVKRATRITWAFPHSLVTGDKKLNRKGRYVDPAFLDMFSFPLIEGNTTTALKDPNSIILSASLAKALFGSEDPMGKTIRLSNANDVKVTGVVTDVPHQSTIDFEFLLPFEYLIAHDEWIRNNRADWSNNFLMNMVELKEGVSMEAFSKKISTLNTQKDARLKNLFLFLHPLSKWHLYNDYKNWVNTGGKITYIWLFGIIGIFVLLIACINFMNLSTARSEKRAREVGIRKVMGSHKAHLIFQFLSEAVLTAFLAFVLSIILIQILLPFLKDLGFENIRFDLSNIYLLLIGLGVCLITGLLAGSYPAFYLSSFIPVKVLKGAFKQGQGPALFRKALVVSQFTISAALIMSTIIVFRQIDHARNRSIGYNPNNMINITASRDLAVNYDALKQELLNTGYFASISKASQPLTAIYNQWSDFSWEGKDPSADLALDAILADWDFEKTAGLQFTQGRAFSRAFPTDSNAIILNEAALQLIGYKDPIGKTMKSGDQVKTIIGVVKNIVLTDPFKAVGPLAIIFNRSKTDAVNNIFLRLQPTADLNKTLTTIKPIFDKYNPSLPFEYNFADEEFGKKFKVENQVGKLASIFAGLTIFISCLGLFGLAMFMAERRIREIGIRKVLGASVVNLWFLLSREFMVLVLIACVIASPLAFWLMHDWLNQYDYRVNISLWIFLAVGILALAIALFTVSAQAIKAALANPVKSLKTE
ncbi:ABC transporter permease [Paraflavitalea soli]|uniref:ABC transporter permease n=1 Tax=Paraflavitalea soli TaxID=2315862 RepID=A0A3B7MV96_9BACT|nr:ABC transporter permease [Paraflavitalea soli]AXY74351.1 ABC transporter permease [Paraflavitalea soli]